MAGSVEVRLDPQGFTQFGRDLREFDPVLYREFRKALRKTGETGVEGVRAKLGEGSPAGGPDVGRMRSLLAAGTRVAVSFAKRGGSVKVTTTAAQLPAEHKAILAAYNTKGEWRHPVFGGAYGTGGGWVAQQGNPYFYGPVMKAGHQEMLRGIDAAIDNAVRAMGARGA